MLVKPNEGSVKNIKEYISKDQDILDFLTAVRCQTFGLKVTCTNRWYAKTATHTSDTHASSSERCWAPSLTIGDSEGDSGDDAKTDEKHEHHKDEDDDKHSDDDRTPFKHASDTNFARHVNRIWLDVHSIIPRTDPGLFIPGMPTDYHDFDEDFVIGTKRSHPGDDEGNANIPGPSKVRRSSKEQQSARDGNKKCKNRRIRKAST